MILRAANDNPRIGIAEKIGEFCRRISGIERHKNRASGSLNLLVFGVLTLTGYALWYASEGGLKQWSVWLHWGLGGVLPLVLIAHIILGRRARA